MIDCIFILLIFFIVATTFVEEYGFTINKPDVGAPPPPGAEDESLAFDIRSNNKIFFENKEISMKRAGSVVKQQVSAKQVPVRINSHEKSNHEVFVALWDEMLCAGATELSFTTTNK